jgi:hypothetical protein
MSVALYCVFLVCAVHVPHFKILSECDKLYRGLLRIFFLASVVYIYSMLVFSWSGDKVVSQNWHCFGSVMSHYSMHMISVDYHCCIK